MATRLCVLNMDLGFVLRWCLCVRACGSQDRLGITPENTHTHQIYEWQMCSYNTTRRNTRQKWKVHDDRMWARKIAYSNIYKRNCRGIKHYVREQSVSGFWPELYKYDASSPKHTDTDKQVKCVHIHRTHNWNNKGKSKGIYIIKSINNAKGNIIVFVRAREWQRKWDRESERIYQQQ